MVTAVEAPDAITEPTRSRFLDIRWVIETGSTNADVMDLARKGAAEGLVVVADHQTAGRGRAGRTWTAPTRASLLCTVLVRPPAAVAPLVTFALAVAASEAVEALAGFRPGLKWPNDLVVEGADGTTRKLAGILAEAEWPTASTAAAGWRAPQPYERATVAAGIGLNVVWPDEVPAELAEIAIAINHVTGQIIERQALLTVLLDRFDLHYSRLVAGDVAAVLDAWRARSSTLGRRVRVELGADDLVGTAVDITAEGQLVVDTLEGERRVLAVGDVVHLRPAD